MFVAFALSARIPVVKVSQLDTVVLEHHMCATRRSPAIEAGEAVVHHRPCEGLGGEMPSSEFAFEGILRPQ